MATIPGVLKPTPPDKDEEQEQNPKPPPSKAPEKVKTPPEEHAAQKRSNDSLATSRESKATISGVLKRTPSDKDEEQEQNPKPVPSKAPEKVKTPPEEHAAQKLSNDSLATSSDQGATKHQNVEKTVQEQRCHAGKVAESVQKIQMKKDKQEPLQTHHKKPDRRKHQEIPKEDRAEQERMLRDWVQSQKQWAHDSEGVHDPFETTVRQGLLLSEIGVPLDPSLQTFTAVVGDQSAGKTVVVTALLQQVILDVKEDIGTTMRTFVKQACNLSQKEPCLCNLSYKGSHDKDLSLSDLQKKYEDLNKENKKTDHKIDTTDVCDIIIRTKKPSMGLQVMDHPGFTFELLKQVKEAFEKTFNDFFMSQAGRPMCKNSSVLLCHSTSKGPSEGAHLTLTEFYSQLGQGQMFAAITKCDLLDGPQRETIAKRMTEAGYKVNSETKTVQVKPGDILDFLETDLICGKKKSLPTHTEVFFVTGYKGLMQNLLQETDPQLRFEHFKSHPTDGMEATEAQFRKALRDKAAWEECGVKLSDETPDETQAVEKRIGMNNLISALKRRAADGFKDVAGKVSSEFRRRKEEVEEKLVQERHAVDPMHVADTMRLVLRHFVDAYYTMADGELYNPRAGGCMKDGIEFEIHDAMHRVWNKLRPEAGWTLEEERQLFEGLPRRGEFPPEVYDPKEDPSCPTVTVDDWKNIYKELEPDVLG